MIINQLSELYCLANYEEAHSINFFGSQMQHANQRTSISLQTSSPLREACLYHVGIHSHPCPDDNLISGVFRFLFFHRNEPWEVPSETGGITGGVRGPIFFSSGYFERRRKTYKGASSRPIVQYLFSTCLNLALFLDPGFKDGTTSMQHSNLMAIIGNVKGNSKIIEPSNHDVINWTTSSIWPVTVRLIERLFGLHHANQGASISLHTGTPFRKGWFHNVAWMALQQFHHPISLFVY